MKRILVLIVSALSLAVFGCDDSTSEDCQCQSNQICKNGTCVNNAINPGGDNTNPGGENTNPGGDNTNPGGDNTNPGGDNTNPGGDNTNPGGENTNPGGENTGTSGNACDGITCSEGTCDEGVCVTSAMKKYKSDDLCDPETFIDFCDGETAVYCDNGIVIVADTPCGKDKCVIYMDTTLSRPRKKATCSEGSCTDLGKIETSCETIKGYGSVVYATACLKTTRNTMETVNIDGYYCMGSCNSSKTKCELVEGECHPYETTPTCDGQQLITCYMNSNLEAISRKEFCNKACIHVGGKDMCGLETCQEAGARKNICGYADSTIDKDSLDTICVQADDEKYYQVRTGLYEVCNDSCDRTTGECK